MLFFFSLIPARAYESRKAETQGTKSMEPRACQKGKGNIKDKSRNNEPYVYIKSI